LSVPSVVGSLGRWGPLWAEGTPSPSVRVRRAEDTELQLSAWCPLGGDANVNKYVSSKSHPQCSHSSCLQPKGIFCGNMFFELCCVSALAVKAGATPNSFHSKMLVPVRGFAAEEMPGCGGPRRETAAGAGQNPTSATSAASQHCQLLGGGWSAQEEDDLWL